MDEKPNHVEPEFHYKAGHSLKHEVKEVPVSLFFQ